MNNSIKYRSNSIFSKRFIFTHCVLSSTIMLFDQHFAHYLRNGSFTFQFCSCFRIVLMNSLNSEVYVFSNTDVRICHVWTTSIRFCSLCFFEKFMQIKHPQIFFDFFWIISSVFDISFKFCFAFNKTILTNSVQSEVDFI